MTEIPEHLLRRSKDRRKALGIGGDDAAGGEASSESAPATAEGGGAAPPATTAPAGVAPAAPAPEPVYYSGPKEQREELRSRIPGWMVPVLALLPVWAIVYFGALGEPAEESEVVDPMVLGAQVFASNCAACHGGSGEGSGAYPKLADGEVKKTFPDDMEADHIEFVTKGANGAAGFGNPYGDPNREGGQRVVKTGEMPPFEGKLSDDEIAAVVAYEREGL